LFQIETATPAAMAVRSSDIFPGSRRFTHSRRQKWAA
jgi:hypothetical protein